MKKKVLAGIMMAVMMAASVMGVSAANSKTAEVYVSGNSANTYVVEAADDQNLKASAEKVDAVSGKEIITTTAVYNVKAIEGNGTANGAGKYEVELTVSGLSSNCKDVTVLNYNTTSETWSVVTVSNVDYTNKTMVVALDNLGPIAIFASVTSGGATGTSPSTVGTSSTWMIMLALAVVAVGAGVVATQKKSR